MLADKYSELRPEATRGCHHDDAKQRAEEQFDLEHASPVPADIAYVIARRSDREQKRA